jgi:hypothetical protein
MLFSLFMGLAAVVFLKKIKFYFVNNSIFDANNRKKMRYKDFKNHKNY